MAGQYRQLAVAAAGLGTAQRVAAAAVLGLVIAVVLAGIWRMADKPQPRNPLNGLGQAVVGIGAGAAVAAAGCLAGFAVLQVQPWPLTGPVAVVAAYVVIRGLVAAMPAGEVPQWLAVAGLPPTLALVALAAARGWPQLAGLLGLAALLAAAWALPAPVHGAIQRRSRRAKLAALPFPLMLPTVPGYKIASASPVGDMLAITMVRADSGRQQWGGYAAGDLAFTVSIMHLSDTGPTAVLARCLAEGRPAGPSQWILVGIGRPQVIARHGDVLAEALAFGGGTVPLSALIQATANLHRVTMDALMARN
jgi:hypothetical protein